MNRLSRLRFLILIFTTSGLAPQAVAGDPKALTETTQSPRAAVRAVGLNEAVWDRGFWYDRMANLRTRMLPAMIELMEGTNVSQYLENFRIAAGIVDGRPRGAPFNDGDFYKLLEAISATLATFPDKDLEAFLERSIAVIAAAQRSDGYLHTPVLIRARRGDSDAVPFRDRHNFEMYNLGHLITAACVHHRVTGRRTFLEVALRAADFLGRTFGDASPEAARSSVCPSHLMAMVELWRTTRDPRHLDLARRFFELRSRIADGGDDNQDRIPFEDQVEAVGHAVRANYLYAGATDLFLETGDPSLWKPLELIWADIVERKMHLTGGCGALYDGASPDGGRNQRIITRTHQAYGRNYQLPNTTAHNETCAAIGSVLWNWRMFLATGDGRFVDVLERALYNGVLSGVGLDGTTFFYTNPLRVTDPMPVELRWSRRRVPYVSSFCCPPNLLRTLAESASYAYALTSDSIWVNLYGTGSFTTTLGGKRIRISQETEYPWNGRVRIRIDECGDGQFSLRLRFPGWARPALMPESMAQATHQVQAAGDPDTAHRIPYRIRGAPDTAPLGPDGYVVLKRTWHSGDTLDLDIPMPVERIEANPLVEETLNQVAVQRGPLVYCLESADLPAETPITSVMIPDDIDLIARYDSRLLGGTAVLEGTAVRRSSPPWGQHLYRPVSSGDSNPLPVRLIPYCLWANRAPGEMTVWFSRIGPGPKE